MLNRRLHWTGVFAVLLALIAQLGLNATMPQVDLVAGAVTLCHSGNDLGGAPGPSPRHSADCPVCPLCGALHVQVAVLVPHAPITTPSDVAVLVRPELPPPSIAPPAPHRPPSQPRAPPTLS